MARPVKIPKRVRKITYEIARLPTELHDAILQRLRFTDVAYLSLAAADFPSLLASIQHGPAWRWLLENSLQKIQYHWNILDELSWELAGHSWTVSCHAEEGVDKLRNLKTTSAELKAIFTRLGKMNYYVSLGLSPGNLMERHLEQVLLCRLEASFGRRPPPKHYSTSRNRPTITWADRRGISMFIPENVRQAIINGDKLPESWDSTEPWQEALVKAPTDEAISECAVAIRNYCTDEPLNIVPILIYGLKGLRAAQSFELTRMRDLYDAHSKLLKKPLAPQSPRRNPTHIVQALDMDAKYALRRPICPWRCEVGFRLTDASWYRFRNQLLVMVPYDWCLSLFDLAVKKLGDSLEMIETSYPGNIVPHLRTAIDGFHYVYEHSDCNQRPPRERIISHAFGHVSYRLESGDISGCPRPAAEMEWLQSFLVCVQWMVRAMPEDTHRLQQQLEHTTLCRNFKIGNTFLSGRDYAQLAGQAAPEELAQWLHMDSKVCDQLAGGVQDTLPSLLAFYMPPYSAVKAKMVARHMVPGSGVASPALQQILYEQTLEKIVGYLSKPLLNADEDDDYGSSNLMEGMNLEFANTDESRAESEWQEALKAYEHTRSAKQNKQRASKSWPRLCYIFRFTIGKPHAKFTSMCIPCGDFNLAGSRLALSNTARGWGYFRGETALVTGGRVNLGFHVALQLLRQSVKVIITTRYPQDAQRRFQGEPDCHRWRSRLTILGADFRCGADVFEVVRIVKKILNKEKSVGWGEPRLKFLINNAAQTLTDPAPKEQHAIEREVKLLDEDTGNRTDCDSIIPAENKYRPRVRGGVQSQLQGSASGASAAIETSSSTAEDAVTTTVETLQGPSSWAQSLSEIPYDDVISAHSVNTFSPLILIRELVPLMGVEGDRRWTRNPIRDPSPISYVINVSSREGIFEMHRGSRVKRGKHVHTNMSKAGLNMITETEAATLWKERGIAMNTVDPGYMSAAPECEDAFGGERPLGWEDGVGRVLWPIHRMEKAYRTGGEDMEKYWGRFFKHYGAVRVDPRFGRS